MYLDLMGFLLK